MKQLLLASLIVLTATSASAFNWHKMGFIACSVMTFGVCMYAAGFAGDTVEGVPVGRYVDGERMK